MADEYSSISSTLNYDSLNAADLARLRELKLQKRAGINYSIKDSYDASLLESKVESYKEQKTYPMERSGVSLFKSALNFNDLSDEDKIRLNQLERKEKDGIPYTVMDTIDKISLDSKSELKHEFAAIDRDMKVAREAVVAKGEEFSNFNSLFTVTEEEEALAESRIKVLEEDRAQAQKIKDGKIPIYNAAKQQAAIEKDIKKSSEDIKKNISKIRSGETSLTAEEWELRNEKFMFPKPDILTESGDNVLILNPPKDSDYTDNKTGDPVLRKPSPVKSYKLSVDPKIPSEKDLERTPEDLAILLKQHRPSMDRIFEKAGHGKYNDQMVNWFKNIDRNGINMLPPNYETSDVTLITRPCLPLSNTHIRHDPMLRMLDTNVSTSKYLYIRCLLDRIWAHSSSNAHTVNRCKLYNPYSPWLTCVSNGLLSISGFPDPQIETKTTEGGYHQEDQTYVKGGLGLHRSVTLNLNFKDIQGGPLLTLFEVWCRVMAQLRDGTMMSYLKYIDYNTIPYSVSIYRFNLDPSKQYITNWCKATTCYPLTYPMGAIMNVSEHQRHITSSGQFTIPFMSNFISYNELTHLIAFNRLTERHVGEMVIKNLPNLPNRTENNYKGIPYIEADEYGFKLVYKDISKMK